MQNGWCTLVLYTRPWHDVKLLQTKLTLQEATRSRAIELVLDNLIIAIIFTSLCLSRGADGFLLLQRSSDELTSKRQQGF